MVKNENFAKIITTMRVLNRGEIEICDENK
jgi:hypothetical protein